MRLARIAGRIEEMRSVYKILVDKPKRKRLLRIPRLRWKDNIKMSLRGGGGNLWTELIYLKIGTRCGLL
jgi:hypothetical protein